MTKTRFSHAECQHPSTKAARAKCRKEMRAAATGESAASTPKPVAVTPTKKKDPRKAATAAPAKVETPAAPEKVESAEPTTAHVSVNALLITRDNWREYKGRKATVHVYNEQPIQGATVTGWSIKFFQYQDAEGKGHRIAENTVERVLLTD